MSLNEKSGNLTIGSLWANIWRISWPMMLIMFFNFLVGLTDIYVAGFISPDVQAVVGFVGQLYFLIIIAANAISMGTVALVSRAIGANDFRGALDTARQSLYFGIIVAVSLSAIGIIFHKQIVFLAGFPPGIGDTAESFLKIFALALGPNYLLIIANAIFRAGGEVKKTLLAMFLVSVINIAANFILVFGIFSFKGFGAVGIAAATAVSVTAGMIISMTLFTTGRWKALYGEIWHLSPVIVGRIVSLSWPAAMLQIAWNAGSIFLYNILGRLDQASIIAMASLTNGLRIEAFIYLPAFALNMAASVLVGQNLGAGNPGRAEKIGWKIALSGVALISALALIIFVEAERLAGLVTRSPAVLNETAHYLRITMLSEPFMALSAILGGSIQGAGDTRGAMWVIIIAMWAVRIPLAVLFAFVLGLGASGVWIAMVTSMMIQGILMAALFRGGRWKILRLDK